MFKSPLVYYGGKNNMLKYILPNLPKDHSIFVEPFGGSLCVLLAKEPSKNEVANDTSSALMNFFSVLTSDYAELKRRIDQTPYSRIAWKVARTMHEYPQWFDRIQRAWAYFILSTQSFSGNIASWGPYNKGTRSLSYERKKGLINPMLRKRLARVQMECKDAVELIQQKDSPETLVYADPPYYNSNCKPYESSYTEDDYRKLLETLANMKGRFLLSSYPSNILDVFVKRYGWYQKAYVQPISVNRTKTGKNRQKVEVLTANYPLEEATTNLH